MTRRGDRQLETNQRKRATDLVLLLDRKGYLRDVALAGPINAIQNFLQREHILGVRAARLRGRK